MLDICRYASVNHSATDKGKEENMTLNKLLKLLLKLLFLAGVYPYSLF